MDIFFPIFQGKAMRPVATTRVITRRKAEQHYSPKAALLSILPFGKVLHALLLGSTLNSTSSIKLRCPSATQQLTVAPL